MLQILIKASSKKLMDLYPHQYYHIYNRSNNNEDVFKSPENYLFFLQKYRHYFEKDFATLAYCLMPTHFHFLIYIKSENVLHVKKNFGTLLSSYSKAINKKHDRHGSIFQQHTRAKHIDDDRYLITLLTYIHQNPVRSGLVHSLSDWEFSSYRDYIGLRNGTLPEKEIISNYFSSMKNFKAFSETTLQYVKEKYWI
ncbi:MAG: transposase [Ignavibacteriales bacterium]|nr:transposase [Ignavibacteriales bacterium]